MVEVILVDNGTPDKHVFADVAERVRDGRIPVPETGLPVVIGTTLLIRGARFELPPRHVLYDLEQLEGSPWLGCGLSGVLVESHARGCPIWVHHPSSQRILSKIGVPAIVVPIPCPSTTVAPTTVEKMHDAIFVGCCSPRRTLFINALRKHGLDVLEVTEQAPLYGQDLLAEVDKSRVVANVHFYSRSWIFEAVRCLPLVERGAVVVSEDGDPWGESQGWQGRVKFAPYERLADAVQMAVEESRAT